MQLPALTKNAMWITAAFGLRAGFRLAANVALSRLLFPEAFGIMAVVNSVLIGMELLTDVGVGQNIITNRKGSEPQFYNTAWTMQIIRGFGLCIIFVFAAQYISMFYEHMDILTILYATSAIFLFSGFQSTNLYVLQKTHRVREYELLNLYCDSAALAFMVTAAYFYPSVWVLVIGGILSTVFKVIASHLIPDAGRNRLFIEWAHFAEILNFGKWVFVSSIVYFLSTNFDRLYLAKAIPLELLGVYGVARGLAEVASGLVGRIASLIAFPLVSSLADLPRAEMKLKVAGPRLRFLLIVATGLACVFSISDLVVGLLYDSRYASAAWILPVLLTGVWFSVLAVFAESMLLGLGNPHYMATANAVKFVYLICAVPLGFAYYGMLGAVAAVAAGDLPRYAVTIPMQHRVKASFYGQDLAVTIYLLAVTAVLLVVRNWLGLGSVAELLPL